MAAKIYSDENPNVLLFWASCVKESTKSASPETRQILMDLVRQIPAISPTLKKTQRLVDRLQVSVFKYDPELHRLAVEAFEEIRDSLDSYDPAFWEQRQDPTPPRISPCVRRKLFFTEEDKIPSLL